MIVVGVDPGARDTGLAVVSTLAGRHELLASLTVRRDKSTALLEPPVDYLLDVTAAVADAARTFDADLIAVEGLAKPHAHHRGKLKPVDPSAVMALAATFGAIIGRTYMAEHRIPVVVIPPAGNGSRPPAAYPDALVAPRQLGARQHERSAYDVALAGPTAHRFATALATSYAPAGGTPR